jgi:hypothetical protein
MGYTTDFEGRFNLSRELTRKEDRELREFADRDHRKETNVPGYYCQWVPTDDGLGIAWDGGEKFYEYVEWLNYIIEHFMRPWGITVNGEVKWFGESSSDTGMIVVTDNVVTTKKGRLVYD